MSAEPPEDFPPEQKEALLRAIDIAMRRQRLLKIGYSLALIAIVSGMLGSFWLYGYLPEESFRGWVFLAPITLGGSILWIFGHLARRRKF